MLRTPRLLLRRWRDDDREPFADLNADPVVMEHFPSTLDRAPFVGFVGLAPATFEAPFTPAVEVGWRLDRRWWGHGIATEAARAAVADGFERVGLEEIVSFTASGNLRSRQVMERLGMVRDPDGDFEHPNVPVGSPVRSHVLYRLRRPGC